MLKIEDNNYLEKNNKNTSGANFYNNKKKVNNDFTCCSIDNINVTSERLRKYCQKNKFNLKEVRITNYVKID